MLRFALCPDSFKLVYGNDLKFHPAMLDKMPRTLSLAAAVDMPATFQLLVCADEDWTLKTGDSFWLSQKLNTLTVRVQAPSFLKLSIEDMHTDDDGYARADALLTEQSKEQGAGMTCAVFCELAFPQDTAPGEYDVTLRLFTSRLFEDETEAGSLSVHVTLFPASLPKREERKFYLDLWQHSSNIARTHETPLWSDAHFAVLEPYVRSLAELGQRAVTLVVCEVPWAGQGCFREYRNAANLYEYSIIPLRRTREGKLEADFGPMQRYIDLCGKYGICEELSVYGLMNVWCGEERFAKLAAEDPDALRVRYYDETEGCFRFLRTEQELEEYIAMIGEYFRTTGQIDRVRIVADEPAETEKYRASLERIRRIEPEFRFKAALSHAEFIEEFGNEISDFVPYAEDMFSNLALLRQYRTAVPDKRILWYTCCVPYWPNSFLCKDLCETLFIGPITSFCRLDGFLRWSYTEWNDDPRHDVKYGDFAAGDCFLVYPSAHGAPLLSLRWMAYRKTIWLYELLEQVRARFGDEEADGLIRLVLKNDHLDQYYKSLQRDDVCSCDPEDYEKLLRSALTMLSGS